MISRREKICVQDVQAVSGISEITDPVRGVETATLELSRCLDMSRPWNDKSSEGHIGAGLIAMEATLLHQIVTELAKPESGIDEQSRCHDLGENIQNIEHIRIGNHG